MTERRNAILLFSKPPVSGLVKTRLTPIKDGVFFPEDAAYLYHCMFFDVVEICCDAIREMTAKTKVSDRSAHEQTLPKESSDEEITDSYDIIISTTPKNNLEVMEEFFRESGEWPYKLTFIYDSGASFDEHYNDSFNQVWEMGYDTILSMGGDMPALPRSVILEGFKHLHELCAIPGGGIVISPDQIMGVSLVGWTKDTEFDHTGVYYNPTGLTVLPAYIEKAKVLKLPARLITAVPDVDSMLDLMHNVTLVQATEYCAQFQDLSIPWRTINALHELEFDDMRVPPNELRDSREGIDV